jgi:SulP family sulfate permease
VLRMSRSIVRREYWGDNHRSRRARDAGESALLGGHGRAILMLVLEGPVFFGSADSLTDRIEAASVQGARYVILDMKRVNDLDSTGARLLLQAHERLKARGVRLLLASVDSVQHVNIMLRDTGVLPAITAASVFSDADRALEWAENHLIGAVRSEEAKAGEYPLAQLDLLAGFSEQERERFGALLARREYAAGEVVFREGAGGDELFIIVKGSASVKMRLPGAEGGGARAQRLVTFGPGTVFGEMALLDRETRSASVEAEAEEQLVCYVLGRSAYESVEREMHSIALKLLTNLGRELSARLRRANRMLNQLES